MRKTLRAAALVSALWLGLGCSGASLDAGVPPAADGQEATEGLSWLSRASLNAFLRVQAWREANPGYVSLFARDGAVVYATAVGVSDLEAARPMTLDTRFRLASMTKPVTAVAAHILIEDGVLGLDDPIGNYLPKANTLRVAASHDAGPDGTIPTVALETPVTVRHLLLFASGIGNGWGGDSDLHRVWQEHSIYDGGGDLQARVDRMFDAPLFEEPGVVWRYGWAADALAAVIEVAAGEPFDAFVERRIFAPLGMDATSFLPPGEDASQVAAMYEQSDDGLRRVDVTPEEHWTPGGSGLVGTAGDYMRFALMLWNGGSYQGVRILSEETVREMTRPHLESGVLVDEGIEGLGWGLGLAVVVDGDATLQPDRTGDYWWAGAYGTTFFVSPSTDLVGMTLTQNRMGPQRDAPYTIYLANAFGFFGL